MQLVPNPKYFANAVRDRGACVLIGHPAAFTGPLPSVEDQLDIPLEGAPEIAVAKIPDTIEELLRLPQIECPVRHSFSRGCYIRTITMPRGAFIIGAEHLTEHFNIVHTGRALVAMNGTVAEVQAPHVFSSGVGVRKTLAILETMEWSTVHVTEETDPEKIAQFTVRKSTAQLDSAMRSLQAAAQLMRGHR